MSLENLTGRWEGVFTYGPQYPVQWQIKKEIFAIDLFANGHNFKGPAMTLLQNNYLKRLHL